MPRFASVLSSTFYNAPGSDINPYKGSTMVFAQGSAPTGWTKETIYDDYALRITTGVAGTGGSVPFLTAMTASYLTPTGTTSITTTVGGTALNPTHICGHYHPGYVTTAGISSPIYPLNRPAPATVSNTPTGVLAVPFNGVQPTAPTVGGQPWFSTTPGSTQQYEKSSPGAGGQPHTHPGTLSGTFTGTALSMAVKYMDCILATKS